MDDSEKIKILRERAKLLAQKKDNNDDKEPSIRIIEFILGEERYAVETHYLQEVYHLKEITPLPCTPAFVSGIINLRGRILSIIDLKIFLGLQQKSLNKINKVIIIKKDDMEFGIQVDSIIGVSNFLVKNFQLPPPALSGIGASYLLGISLDGLIILNAEGILDDKKIVIHEEV
jgi:purine-binding chemotaxis protein CheW